MKPKTVGRVLTQTGETAQCPIPMAGLVAGTLVLTGDGALPVEFLTPGERVISRAHGMVHLSAIEALTETANLVRVYPGALGANKPDHITMMPSAQRVLLRDTRVKQFSPASQAVVPIGCLVDDATITDMGRREIRVFRLSFDRPEVIYADGIEIAVSARAISRAKAA